MCTFIMLYQMLEDYPVIALHNRYLGLDTQEKPPQSIGDGVYCPIDIASAGTWFGFNKDGLLLAITNQETETIENPTRSRGLLALDILRDCSSAIGAKEYLLDPSIRPLYRPGNFVVADAETAWHVLWDHTTTVRELHHGPYAMGVVTMYPGIELSERAEKIGLDSERRRRRANQMLRDYNPDRIEDALEKMKQVSADHQYGKSTSSICWHSTEFKQTSSTIIALNSAPENSHVYYCPGNACETSFTEYTVSFD